ncbi:MAG: hypothetical protein B7Z12_00005, partial [Caulobacter vibrioides]
MALAPTQAPQDTRRRADDVSTRVKTIRSDDPRRGSYRPSTDRTMETDPLTFGDGADRLKCEAP